MESKLLKTYRGYDGTIEYSDEDGIFWGKVLGISDSVAYDGASIEELDKDFHDAVDCYLEIEQNEKGEWIIEVHEDYTIARCPACGKEAVTDEYTGKPILSNYCPECGKELRERAATYKVGRNEAGKLVIEDIAVLDLYEQEGVEIDRATGTPLLPGKRAECFGNGEHEGFACCCDECDHYSDCYQQFLSDDLVGILSVDVDDKKALRERLEDLLDLNAAERAIAEYEKNPKTYTFDEVLAELGITREELEAMPDVELELE